MDNDFTLFLKDLHLKKKKAWEKLYEMYYPSMCNYISRLIKNEQDAADLTQKIFIKLWEGKVNFINAKTLTAYLYRSARNTSINYLKHQKVEYKRLQAFITEAKSKNELDESVIMMIEEEMIRELYKCIDELPKRQGEVLTLTSKGLTVKQVAEKLNISENTVKTQKRRAYLVLKEKLKNSLFLMLFMSV